MATVANITVNDVPENTSVKVVNVSGELDESNLPEFEGVVNPLVKDLNNKILIFNLNGLEFISSKVIGQFAYFYTTLSHSQRKIMLADLGQDIKDIFVLVGLDQMIPEYSSLDEALKVANEPVIQQSAEQTTSEPSSPNQTQ